MIRRPFTYVGCKTAVDSRCDECGAKPEIIHKVQAPSGAERAVCRACADEMVLRRDQGMPRFCETWSRRDGGKWISRWHAEDFNR